VSSVRFEARLQVIPATDGKPRTVGSSIDMKGLCWLPDGTGLIYSSSKGSTVAYPPIYSLRLASLSGAPERQLTFGDVSYLDPDANPSGALLVTRGRNQSDVWRVPVDGAPAENARAAVRITHQTGVAQTPSLSPDGKELVFLSDSGGHGNLWVAKTDGSGVRQITFERDAAKTVGVPVWSPTSDQIAFIFTREGQPEQWLVNRDGSGLRRLTTGVWSYWSPDAKWLYVTSYRSDTFCIDKAPLAGGPLVSVRCDNSMAAALSPDGATLYYVTPLLTGTGGWDLELRKARPENGPSTVLRRLAGTSVPLDAFNVHTIVSPDGHWLAQPLTDGTTSNLWAISTEDGALKPLTDFGQRVVTIARRTSWSADGKSIYAALADVDSDVVLLRGLFQP
jgi:Tol biopolymer transport system component